MSARARSNADPLVRGVPLSANAKARCADVARTLGATCALSATRQVNAMISVDVNASSWKSSHVIATMATVVLAPGTPCRTFTLHTTGRATACGHPAPPSVAPCARGPPSTWCSRQSASPVKRRPIASDRDGVAQSSEPPPPCDALCLNARRVRQSHTTNDVSSSVYVHARPTGGLVEITRSPTEASEASVGAIELLDNNSLRSFKENSSIYPKSLAASTWRPTAMRSTASRSNSRAIARQAGDETHRLGVWHLECRATNTIGR